MLPFLNKDLKAFLAEPMASAVAAQFLVSRQAVLTRPLLFWQELQALTNGTKSIRRYVCASLKSYGVAFFSLLTVRVSGKGARLPRRDGARWPRR